MTEDLQTQSPPRQRPRANVARRVWVLMLLDVMAVAWMVSAGRWFDQGLLSVVTLGGHPRLVTALATASFVLLACLTVSTGGFERASTAEIVLVVIGCLLAVVALAGLFSLVLLVVCGGVLLGLLARLVHVEHIGWVAEPAPDLLGVSHRAALLAS